MSEAFVSRVGGTISADIAVPEHDREKRFYAQVLCTGDKPLWRDDLMNSQGIPIIGLGARTPDHDALPLQWMPHIQVVDIATSVARAVELGGMELMHGKADDGSSQWAVLQDPNGAAFGIIPVVPPEAVPAIDGDASEFGCIAWLDLTVADASATSDFYQQVIGWAIEDVEMDDAGERYADYNMVGGDGNAAAGICHARGANTGLPPVWMIYLPVGDLAESIRLVPKCGGTVIKTHSNADGEAMIAFVQDPVGAYFALAAQ